MRLDTSMFETQLEAFRLITAFKSPKNQTGGLEHNVLNAVMVSHVCYIPPEH